MSTKDMMPNFDLFQPSDMENAFDLLEQYGADAWPLAGGQDSLDWFKDRIKRPVAVIDLAGIPGMSGINEIADGIEIGALTTLTEIAESPLIQDSYGLLAEAASRVASPQIRNIGTLGGNVCQDVRCWYYRSGLDCYRAGGNTCYADTPEGLNREHCLFEADRCVAVTPSDTAPALVALAATMVIQNSAGSREVAAEDFFIGPDVDIERVTVLEPGDILTSIKIPSTWAGASYYFEKVADRETWDFALVNVAAVLRFSGETIEDLRVVCGGVQCTPRRLNGVEDIVRGSTRDEETINLAAGAAARGATTLNYNQFKIPLMENLVKRAIRDS
ncbi:xanthine dehydrogenase family protein subunit M [Haliea sp. AH-315-K21]|uniref:Molybdopterin dehydrogenase n=1 Tax=SAR86 cluster bacterium TaxID=2030880 RepID=A0A2A5C8S4_9GAMM|nr:xanthine dehydrogenase family protein subunit M [Haliea sp. AH-315-K21]MBN4075700.1 xanthine dehydrogenase family protein subunit M [Gammaproteobacteria bacterium AH-315-E17]PCJ39975.1 MAG: molybdopterin dehydrogenase [SAR86 cluster bacterium]